MPRSHQDPRPRVAGVGGDGCLTTTLTHHPESARNTPGRQVPRRPPATLTGNFSPMIKPADNPLLNYFVNNSGRVIHKWLHYFEIYHRYLDRFRACDTVDLLEIGIQNGGSATMWRDYFGASRLRYVGVDSDPRCANLRAEGFEIHIGDQASRDFWQGIKARHSRFDVILDDGGHTMDQQIVTFRELFPLLKDGGVYLCEDTHTSYLEEFGGGLKRPGTFIELVKNLIDDLHGWYYQEDAALAANQVCRQVYSLALFDSLVVIEKRFKNPPLSLSMGTVGHVANPQVMGPRFLRRA